MGQFPRHRSCLRDRSAKTETKRAEPGKGSHIHRRGKRAEPLSAVQKAVNFYEPDQAEINFIDVAYIGYYILTFYAVFADGSGAVALTVIKSGSRRAAKPAHFSGTICEAQRSDFRGKYEPHKVKEIAR